jgi:hypothetical protein
MFRVPCPGTPGAGKWLREYLREPLSTSMRERRAAWAPKVLMLKLWKAMAIAGAARRAGMHSGREEAQVAVSGAMVRRVEVVKVVSMALVAWVGRVVRARRVVRVWRRVGRGMLVVDSCGVWRVGSKG